MKFYIHAEFLDTKLLVLRFRRLPEHTNAKYIYGNFANFNSLAIVNTSCRKNNALQNSMFLPDRALRVQLFMQKHYGTSTWGRGVQVPPSVCIYKKSMLLEHHRNGLYLQVSGKVIVGENKLREWKGSTVQVSSLLCMKLTWNIMEKACVLNRNFCRTR